MIPSMAGAASANDAFYKYTGSTPLASIAPGTPLKTRNIPYHILGFATPLRATQILYRATDAQGRPTVNVTSVIQPTCFLCLNREKVISYQSFYDSLNPERSAVGADRRWTVADRHHPADRDGALRAVPAARATRS